MIGATHHVKYLGFSDRKIEVIRSQQLIMMDRLTLSGALPDALAPYADEFDRLSSYLEKRKAGKEWLRAQHWYRE